MPTHLRVLPLLLVLAACGTKSEDTAACPPADCGAGPECLEAATPGDASAFTLRATQISIDAPSAFTSGVLGATFAAGPAPALPECGVDGSATWNLLLGFDTSAETLEISSARPGSTGTAVDEAFGQLHVAPVSASVTVGQDGSFTASAVDAVLAVFLDESGSDVVLLPVHGELAGTLSASHACIGAYDSMGLAAVSCAADADHPAFTEGGSFAGYIPIEEADKVEVTLLGQSLCVLLSGDITTYGNGELPSKCARDDSGKIEFRGDWCSATNMPGDSSCNDAVKFSFGFAASAI